MNGEDRFGVSDYRYGHKEWLHLLPSRLRQLFPKVKLLMGVGNEKQFQLTLVDRRTFGSVRGEMMIASRFFWSLVDGGWVLFHSVSINIFNYW